MENLGMINQEAFKVISDLEDMVEIANDYNLTLEVVATIKGYQTQWIDSATYRLSGQYYTRDNATEAILGHYMDF